MNRSTTLYIAVATLILGSGTSFFAFVKPALDEQAKLKTQKTGLETTQTGLETQVKDLEAKARNTAMMDIAFFDLRASLNQRRELESKTVQTLASLTEIFNDNHIRVQELTPTGETQGLNKPIPSAAPSAAASPGAVAAAPSPSPSPSPAAAPGQPAPIQLTHKAFKIAVRGEYADLVKALSEIQGLPKAISVNQYDLKLLDKGDQATPPPQPDAKKGPESPTALEMTFNMSITFLMAGGTPPAAPSPSAAPVGAVPGTDLVAFANWLLGGTAQAAEAAPSPAPSAPVVAPAAPAQPAQPAAAKPAPAVGGKYHLNGVSFQGGALHIQTSGGTPPYSVRGLSRQQLVVDLANTTLGAGVPETLSAGGAFRQVKVVSTQPGMVRLLLETDGTQRVVAQLDRHERLQLVAAPWTAKPAASARAPKAAHARAAHMAAAALTRLQDVTAGDDELVVHTSGPAPRFVTLGGTKKRLVIDLPHAGIKAPGKVFPVHAGGVEQVRAVLYKNRPMTTRLVIDTDGSVKLAPFLGPDGLLHVRMTALAQPVAKAAQKPVKEAAKTEPKALVAGKPMAPHATPTPMAVPGKKAPEKLAEKEPVAKKPLAKPSVKPRMPPSAFPEGDTADLDAPHLQRSLSTSYRFPIDRERTTGRANPFKVLPSRVRPAPKAGAAGMVPPVPVVRMPSVPLPGLPAAGTPGAVPALPAAGLTAKTYTLTAVVVGGGAPPLAMIKVDGKTHMVGLNESLPGNATVKSIQADYVILTSNDQDIRLGLKK